MGGMGRKLVYVTYGMNWIQLIDQKKSSGGRERRLRNLRNPRIEDEWGRVRKAGVKAGLEQLDRGTQGPDDQHGADAGRRRDGTV